MKLVKAWYSDNKLVWLLVPFSALFYVLSATRRLLYRFGVFASHRVDATVIVVGNLSVGGNGKTPVVIALVEYFISKGFKVGVLSRGYGGKCDSFPHLLTDRDCAEWVGDEPKLIHQRTGAKVLIDPIRARGAQTLASTENCDIIICDDGLQHYALARDIELVVMDERKLGNGHLLPMGPLREGQWRLASVDMIVHNNSDDNEGNHPVTSSELQTPQFTMKLSGNTLTNVKSRATMTISEFTRAYSQVSALAGIGNPQRFFDYLQRLSIPVGNKIALPDHYQISKNDLPKDVVVMTEKDAVKIVQFASDNCWFLPVTAHLTDAFYGQLDTLMLQIDINNRHKKEEQ